MLSCLVESLCRPKQMVPGAGGTVPNMQRIPLPGAEMLEEEPLYVNAKQYHRILKRRQARAKLEAEGKIPKERRVCVTTEMAFIGYYYITLLLLLYGTFIMYLIIHYDVICFNYFNLFIISQSF